jgi:diguanylate cyclase (GGDEF)-like protein/PAS domain S-box-containing protein
MALPQSGYRHRTNSRAWRPVIARSAKSPALLDTENSCLRQTLDNMIQGVLMFDSDRTIVVRNRRYLQMYGLSGDIVRPGCSLRELLEHRKASGSLAMDVDAYLQRIDELLRSGETSEMLLDTGDGRTVHVVTQPLPNGGWVTTHEDITRQKEAEARIEHMAHHDALTGLPNRVLFHAQLEHALRWRGRGHQVSVLFIDLDNFKSINDTLGHQVGDTLLKTVAARLQDCVRSGDVVARLGGDEFVIVQTELEDPTDAANLATRVREVILDSCVIDNHNLVVDASIGIAVSPDDGTEPDELIKNADLALFGAKASGRGTYRFFEQAMDQRMLERHVLELELRKALVNGEFEVYFQPLVNLANDRIVCCEALLRWNHPERGNIPPDKFIPLAEETGLITRIGAWVIRTACHEAANWPDDVMLAVNISPMQFRSQNLIDIVMQSLASSGLPAERLELEITEAIMLENTEATLATLDRFHRLGVSIAMDDFGTGYSSLSYLQKFPFDKIKIDGSFIQGLSNSDESAAIVRAVAGLARSFRMTTTAEGVETDEQLRIVKDLGCTEMQGHLFSKACNAQEVSRLIDAHYESFAQAPLRHRKRA